MVRPVDTRRRTLLTVLLAQLGALTFVLKMAMAGLPNIEPVSLLVMVFAVSLGWWGLAPVYLYVLLECVIWGVNSWSVCYLYVWLVLFLLARLLRGLDGALGWAVLSGAFGLFFSALCVPVYAAIGGWAYALSWWVSGIPFDLLHCGGNFVLALVLFRPLRGLMDALLFRAGLKEPGERGGADAPRR